MEEISFFYLFLMISSLFMRYCLEVITRILDCPLLVLHQGFLREEGMHPLSVFLCFYFLTNMLSQSLPFAFPCRNSFFIRSSVECSPLELSSL
ncbi:uncharacterized protein DS421_7g209260 [Arachis hypogaea]|nr:uncharacterized protein DS421_7g209260 [Arachis hypogaea]